MILWHMGIAAAIVYVTIGRRRVDYRFVLVGAVLPDLVDGATCGLYACGGGRGVAHSLLANVAVTVAIILFLRGETRLAVFGIGVGWLLHLVADGMWDAPTTFFWPIAGADFAAAPAEPYSWDVFTDPFSHLWTWAGEVVGALILAWFYVAFGLSDKIRRARFFRDGHLRA
ncbi:MAG: metal-dependent hydrolase [Actinobacteria bacterium]|nr:metal-dependent hydrolase [Actinomycetota bacterium]